MRTFEPNTAVTKKLSAKYFRPQVETFYHRTLLGSLANVLYKLSLKLGLYVVPVPEKQDTWVVDHEMKHKAVHEALLENALDISLFTNKDYSNLILFVSSEYFDEMRIDRDATFYFDMMNEKYYGMRVVVLPWISGSFIVPKEYLR